MEKNSGKVIREYLRRSIKLFIPGDVFINKKKFIKNPFVRDDTMIILSGLVFLILFSISVPKRNEKAVLGFTNDPLVASYNQEFNYKLYPENPKLVSNYSDFPVISAQAALAVDLDTMTPLYEKNPEKTLLPASTTKILTFLVAYDYYDLDDVIEVKDARVDGQRLGLVAGEKLKVVDLLYALLVYSANDAAEVLAQNYEGGRENFISAMNRKASELNLDNSHFENPTGFDSDRHFSTAKDLVWVSKVALENQLFSKIVSTKEITIQSIDGLYKHKLTSTNKLLDDPDVLGVKTGWTENARENLVTYIVRDGKKVLIAILGSQDRFGETRELIDWIYKNYKWEEVKMPAS